MSANGRDARIGVWNVEWARAASRRGRAVAGRLASFDCDVLVVTEGERDLLPPGGHVVDSEPDYGYPLLPGRRKVLLWSREPWAEVDRHVAEGLPPGRIAVGVTPTPAGPVRVAGVAIPWRDAHVRSGRGDRGPWQDHLAYLDALLPWLRARGGGPPMVLAGDFNQRLPPAGQPRAVAAALERALDGLAVPTEGLACEGRRLIDHLAHAPGLAAAAVATVPRDRPAGPRLSDHDAVVVALRAG